MHFEQNPKEEICWPLQLSHFSSARLYLSSLLRCITLMNYGTELTHEKGGVLSLEDVPPYGHPSSACANGIVDHLQQVGFGVHLGTTCDDHWNVASFYY